MEKPLEENLPEMCPETLKQKPEQNFIESTNGSDNNIDVSMETTKNVDVDVFTEFVSPHNFAENTHEKDTKEEQLQQKNESKNTSSDETKKKKVQDETEIKTDKCADNTNDEDNTEKNICCLKTMYTKTHSFKSNEFLAFECAEELANKKSFEVDKMEKIKSTDTLNSTLTSVKDEDEGNSSLKKEKKKTGFKDGPSVYYTTNNSAENNSDGSICGGAFNNSFWMPGERGFEKHKDEMWEVIKNNARKKANAEYNAYLVNGYTKLVCVIRKHIKYFTYLKETSYNRLLNSNGITNSARSGKSASGEIRLENKNFFQNTFRLKYSDLSFYQKCNYFFITRKKKIMDLFQKKEIGDFIDDIGNYLKFTDNDFEKMFLNNFYSSLPFKICAFSILMILTSCAYFFILYILVLNFIYEYMILLLSIFKFFFDVLYFLSFVMYILLHASTCIEKVEYYSYKSSYIFIPFTFLHSFILLSVLSNIDLNKYLLNVDTSRVYVIIMTNIYTGLFSFLSNYMIIYNFVMNLKFSIFSVVCSFLFIFSCYSLNYQNNHVFIIFILMVCEVFMSLYYEYNYEKKWRNVFKNEYLNRKGCNNNITRYFSIENLIPTSPLEDILLYLKNLIELIKKIESEPIENHCEHIQQIRANIKKCQDILKTKNLNEIPIFKYKKFGNVYNLWCLDKIDSNINKNINYDMLSLQNAAKDIKNSFSNTHYKLLTKYYEHNKDTFEWNVDIREKYEGNVFITVGYKLLYPLGIIQENFDKNKLKNFLIKIHSHYNDVPYHNSLHAAQVAHFGKSLLYLLRLNDKVPTVDEFCLHVASLCHDVGHPGLNNYFLINSENDLALTYNDNSVLENYHCSLIFKSLKIEDSNIFHNYPYHVFVACRKKIISVVLSTDMKNHFEYISNFRTTKEFLEWDNLSNEHMWQIFCLVLKAADIGHSALNWKKHYEWTQKINEEFYLQGLLEKSMNMQKSILCDIGTTSKLAASQVDFLKHLCLPLFNELNSICKNNEIYNHCIYIIEDNIEEWEKRKDDDENLGLQEKYQNDTFDLEKLYALQALF